MTRKRDAARFYTDERGRVRPITKRNVAAALASGVKIRRVFKENPEMPGKPGVRFTFPTESGLKATGRGWEMETASSSNSSRTYKTVLWLKPEGRFRWGMITCDCPGYIYSKKRPKECRHVREMRRRIATYIRPTENTETVEAKAGRFTVHSNIIRKDGDVALAWHVYPPDPAVFTALRQEKDGWHLWGTRGFDRFDEAASIYDTARRVKDVQG